MGKKGNKRPKQRANPPFGKIPKEQNNGINVAAQRFCWRAPSVDLDGRWGWHVIEARLLFHEIIPKFHDFESMTWGEIEGVTGSHFVSCDDLCARAQERLSEISLDDIEELFSLRITGRRRVWGQREGRILNLLWWDPDHEVCPSNKAHT